MGSIPTSAEAALSTRAFSARVAAEVRASASLRVDIAALREEIHALREEIGALSWVQTFQAESQITSPSVQGLLQAVIRADGQTVSRRLQTTGATR